MSWWQIDSPAIWIIATFVHIVIQQILGLFGNRLLFRKFAKTSYKTRVRLFGLHLVAVATLPTTAWFIYMTYQGPGDSYAFLPVLLTILSCMFNAVALSVTLLTIRRILVSDEYDEK